MNVTINSECFLNLPITTNSTHLAVYTLLLLLSDASGEIAESRSAIAERLHTPVVIIDAAIVSLQQNNLIRCEGSFIYLIDNKAWKLAQQKTRAAQTIAKKVEEKAIPASLNERIEAFARAAKREFATWRERHSGDELPSEEEAAFIRYWTEHNEKATTFRREQEKVWQWQSRITTWFSNYSKRRFTEKAATQSDNSDSIRAQNEETYKRERRQQEEQRRREWAERERNAGGLDLYYEELRKAVNGDEDMRRKYPDWEFLAARNLS